MSERILQILPFLDFFRHTGLVRIFYHGKIFIDWRKFAVSEVLTSADVLF